MTEKALVAVIQEAWIGGVSTRRVDARLAPSIDLGGRCGAPRVPAMGLTGISQSQVSKLCKDIDERVLAVLERPLESEWPCLWLDATALKQREGGAALRGDHRRSPLGARRASRSPRSSPWRSPPTAGARLAGNGSTTHVDPGFPEAV
jgi:Transposase, Mutator family